REGRRRLAQAEKARQEKEAQEKRLAQQRAEDYKSALKHGRDALLQGKPRVAMMAFREALALRPDDAEAGGGLRAAEQANDRLLEAVRQKQAEAEQARERRRAEEQARARAREYDQFMKYGREALLK